VIVLLEFPIAVFHRLQSQAAREPLDRRQEGWFILLTLRPLGLAMWVGVIAFLIDPSSMAWSSVPLPAWLRWAGVGICVMGGGLLTWTLGRLGKNLTDTVITRRTGSYPRSASPVSVCSCFGRGRKKPIYRRASVRTTRRTATGRDVSCHGYALPRDP
jgi:hypothetical protein